MTATLAPAPHDAPPPVVTEAAAALAASPLPQLRRLTVTTTAAEVVLTGRVASYYQKQLAQETVRPAVGSRRLVNHVEVC